MLITQPNPTNPEVVTVWDDAQTRPSFVNGAVVQVPQQVFNGTLAAITARVNALTAQLTQATAIQQAVQSALTPPPK